MQVSDSYSLEKAVSICAIRSVVVVALPCLAKACAAHALDRRAAAQPARMPAPGLGQSVLSRVPQCMKTAQEPESKSPWPPHLKRDELNVLDFIGGNQSFSHVCI